MAGTFSILVIWVISLSYREIIVILLNEIFYPCFGFIVVPFKSIFSVISLKGYSLMLLEDGKVLVDYYFFYTSLFSYSYFQAYYHFFLSFSFAIQTIFWIVYSLNTSYLPYYFALLLIETMMIRVSSESKPRSMNQFPLRQVMVSHSSNPLSMNNLTLQVGKWSHSLSTKDSIHLAYQFSILF